MNLRAPAKPFVDQAKPSSRGPANISNSLNESAPYSSMTSSGLTTLPRDLDIFSPFEPRIIP